MFDDTTLAIGAYAVGLLATLVLAAFLTPSPWWRRPNLRALAIVAAGSWGIGTLLLWSMHAPAVAAPPVTAGIAPVTASVHVAGTSYRVFEALNLRSARGTGARRIAVIPVGASVTPTGARDGDWVQVNTRVEGKPVTGWVSSLWLRRAGEGRR